MEKSKKLLNLKSLKDEVIKKLINYYYIQKIIMKNFNKKRKLLYIKQFLLKLLKQKSVKVLKIKLYEKV